VLSQPIAISIAALTPVVSLIPATTNVSSAQSLTITIVVTGGNDDPVPSGAVRLTSGSYMSPASPLTEGRATITIPAGTLPLGDDTMTVVYIPDQASVTTYSNAVNSTAVTVIPGFAIVGTAVTLVSGATMGNMSIITVVPSGGFTGSVALSAAVTASPANAQNLPTVSFGTSNAVMLNGPNPGTAFLTITTSPAVSSVPLTHKSQNGNWQTAAGAALACLLFVCIPTGRKGRSILAMLALLLALAGGAIACGGKSNFATHPGGTSYAGTTPGKYIVTVTGVSNSVIATGTIPLTVQ
jgi:hypothetical protein